jgi:uncharacterized membrane protein YdjX (TVP38/TMEM64 family)
MKALIKFVVILGAFFTATLLIFKAADLFTIEDIKFWLTEAQKASHWIVGGVIIGLMLIDLFVAIPTLSLTILAGFFLGLELGLIYSSIGMLGAGSMGYFISKYKGEILLKKLAKDYAEVDEMKSLFNRFGPIALTLCRAAPMLPEVTSCLAGVSNMSYWKYLGFYFLGTVPFAAIAVYAGSISTVDDPEPGFIAFGSVFGFLTVVWLVFIFIKRKEIFPKKFKR